MRPLRDHLTSPAAPYGAASSGASNDLRFELRLDDLPESPCNPRRSFDQVALEELAATIKAEGRIHELLVRPIVPPLFEGVEGSTAGHEIVLRPPQRRGVTRSRFERAASHPRGLFASDAPRGETAASAV
jgi:hypothetical protein